MSDLAADLQQLAELHLTGALTDEEFQDAKRARIASEGTQGGSSLPPTPITPKSSDSIEHRQPTTERGQSLCPVCRRDDQVSRTNHIAAAGTSSISLDGSMQGGGTARSVSHRMWRPDQLDSWYTSSTSFAFSASMSLSGSSTTTLASHLAPTLPPDPVPQGDDWRYAVYWRAMQNLSDKSYYCSRDGIVFIGGTDYPPIAPSNYRLFMHYEAAQKVYVERDGLTLETRRLKGLTHTMSVPKTWLPINSYEIGNPIYRTLSRFDGFSPSMEVGFRPFVSVTSHSSVGYSGFLYKFFMDPLGFPNRHLVRPLRTSYALTDKITVFNDGEREGKQTMLAISTDSESLVGWNISFWAFGRLWLFVFATHPSCVALDSILWSNMLGSLSNG
jgi:hypothetical protein